MPIARAIGGAGRVAPRDRDAWREPPLHKILAVPDENLVRAWAITNASPGVGLSRPPSPAATTRAGLPSIRSARASRGREIVAARGLHDRLQPATRSMPRPGRGPRPASFSLATETCGAPVCPRSRRGPDPGTTRLSCSKMLRCPWRHGGCPLAPHVQQDAACHARRPAAVGPHAGTRVCAQIHTRRSVAGASIHEIGSACRLGAIAHEASSSGHPSVDPLRGHLLTCARCWPLAKRRLVRTSS